MKLIHVIAATAVILSCASGTEAKTPEAYPDTFLIPSRAVVVSGDASRGSDLVAILYDKKDLHFNDPNTPRFLFLDREGKVAFGIGGYVKGTVFYDFNGENTDGTSFTPFDIEVPNNPAHRQQLGGSANHSTIFLQLAGRSERFGYYQAFIQTNFTGNGAGGYGLKLKQAYLNVGYVTAGLTRSTFVDGAAGTPTVDDQGPAGEMTGKNILVRYRPTFGRHWSVAVGVEIPQVSGTFSNSTEKISQRVPDIPFNVQYSWGKDSHVRVAGLIRNMTYRDILTAENKFKFGWAAQLSGAIGLGYGFTTYFQGAAGQGYGRYINDLEGNGYDLIAGSKPGEMIAPRTMNFEVGLKFAPTDKLFFATSYSQAHVYQQRTIGPDAYRYGQYISASAFYNIIEDLRVGVEYLHGTRNNYDNSRGTSNRIEGMIQYSF